MRNTDPRKLAFFTGRDQSQALTGWWATQFGTPNYAAHGGFCSVNMAAAGLYTFGGSFWEFGEPDWKRTRYFLLFGVAEDHSSNPIKIGLGELKSRGVKFVSVNPVRTGYSAIADEWLGIRPGTDGLFVAGLIHELLRTDAVDFDYLVRYTNAHWLVIDDPGAADDGLFLRDAEGNPLAADAGGGPPVNANLPGIAPRLAGEAATRRRTARATCLQAAGQAVPRRRLGARGRGRSVAGSPRRRSAASPPNWPTPPSTSRSPSIFRGPTMPAAGTSTSPGARSPCMPCAASRRIPMAFTPAA